MFEHYYKIYCCMIAISILSGCSGDRNNNTPVSTPPANNQPPPPPPMPGTGGGISTSDDIDSRIIYSHGPMKLMMPEQLLDAVSDITGHDFGTYDFTQPATTNNSDFTTFCNSLGGCPDHVSRQRNNSIATVFVITLDKITSVACREDSTAIGMIPLSIIETSTNPTQIEIDTAINWQYQYFFGMTPRQDEMDASRIYFNSHLGKIDPDTGQPTGETDTFNFGTAVRGHCMALLGSSKFIFY